jgi:hypothetical protein
MRLRRNCAVSYLGTSKRRWPEGVKNAKDLGVPPRSLPSAQTRADAEDVHSHTRGFPTGSFPRGGPESGSDAGTYHPHPGPTGLQARPPL